MQLPKKYKNILRVKSFTLHAKTYQIHTLTLKKSLDIWSYTIITILFARTPAYIIPVIIGNIVDLVHIDNIDDIETAWTTVNIYHIGDTGDVASIVILTIWSVLQMV